jgi:hypothetical protein
MAVEVLELRIDEKEAEGVKFYYTEIVSRRASFRVWINPSYYQNELKNLKSKYTLGVFKNARIEKTKRNNYVIKRGTHNVFFIRVKCGYLGNSKIKVISDSVNVVDFFYYHSPNGRLGVSACAMIETAEDVKIQWKRSGRLYGEPDKGISIVKVDGSVQSLNDVVEEEIDEIIAE